MGIDLGSPQGQLKELLFSTQRFWLVAMDVNDREAARNAAHYALAYFGAAFYLKALIEGRDVAETCLDLQSAYEDGGSVGEITWDWLTELGVDPATIEPAKGYTA